MLENFWMSLLEALGLAVWVEITTESPRCTYYFGPFANESEADTAKFGYIEDLEAEGATGVIASIKRCKPAQLTVYDDSSDSVGFKMTNAATFAS